MSDWITIEAGSCQVCIDPSLGNLRDVRVAGRSILHTARWVGDPECGADLPIERKLAGDFFCAPFGGADVDGVPPHGFSANSSWSMVSKAQNEHAAVVKLELDREVFGARLCKDVRLVAGHPAIYQKHTVDGGQGDLTYAHHPMLHIQSGAHVGFSAKRMALTPEVPLEPEHRLAYPARSSDLSRFPAAHGGAFDLHSYPEACAFGAGGHEDFVTLIEAEGAQFGWTAVTRHAEDDIVIFLKDPRTAPVTMLWYSNGGRDFAPWNGTHSGVFGIEDGCTAGAATLAQAAAPNSVSEQGVPAVLSLSPEKRTDIRHAIVSVARPQGWRGVAHIENLGAQMMLRLTSLDGDTLEIPFDCFFF